MVALFLCSCWVLHKSIEFNGNCHTCSDFYCIQLPSNVACARLLCSRVFVSSWQSAFHCSSFNICHFRHVHSQSSFAVFKDDILMLCAIKEGLIQCLFTHSRSCVSNAGNFSFSTHSAHVALIFLPAAQFLKRAFLAPTAGSEMLMRISSR